MLNELLVVERGARRASVEMAKRHPDIKDARRIPTLVVRLDEKGQVSGIRAAPSDVTPWTLRDGQHNSFPFVQPKSPLLCMADPPEANEAVAVALDRRSDDRRAALLLVAEATGFRSEAHASWPGDALLRRLSERRIGLATLLKANAAIVPETLDRFLLACESPKASMQLLQSIRDQLVAELEEVADSDWIEVAASLLIGKFNQPTGRWNCVGGLLFEADGHECSILDSRLVSAVTQAMSERASDNEQDAAATTCGLTGQGDELVTGKFPQPNIPVLGQTFLFAKNNAIRANDRYGMFATDAMPVGRSTANDLAAAFRSLTSEERRGVTWRSLPGEGPKQTDLLLAFVDAALEAPIADAIADDGDFDDNADTDSIAEFEKRTQRVVEAVAGSMKIDFRRTPVRIAVFRKVDPANRKVIYSGTPTVGQVIDAAASWQDGERNLPEWVTLPVLRKGERKPRPMKAPHVAPLGLITFTKQIFLRVESKRKETKQERQEIAGVPAAEALALFLFPIKRKGDAAFRRAALVLRIVLRRRLALVAETAHALRKGFDFVKPFDRREALRTLTVLGILLLKLGRAKEVYMTDTAFRLGQLLAGLDLVHAGYCADVRGGDVPPALLGNQVFGMAQKSPTKALVMIGRRWKPYDGWAKRASRDRRDRERIAALKNSNKKDEQQRGWDILKGLRHAREVPGIAQELESKLADCQVNDEFRAELLLGYMAGFPPMPKGKDADEDSSNTPVANKEEN